MNNKTSMEYIYILSNSSLKKNIHKVGFTAITPESRSESLSRSTAIPSDFVVEFSKEVNDKRAIETRVHLLLSKYRVNKNKEFFKAPFKEIVHAIETACEYADNHEGVSKTFSLSPAISSLFNTTPKLTRNGMDILPIMIAATADNSKAHIFLGLLVGNHQLPTSHNFLSAKNYSNLTLKSHRAACEALRKFCTANSSLTIALHETGEQVKIFKRLEYSKGQCLWAFTNDFRLLISNEKSNF